MAETGLLVGHLLRNDARTNRRAMGGTSTAVVRNAEVADPQHRLVNAPVRGTLVRGMGTNIGIEGVGAAQVRRGCT